MKIKTSQEEFAKENTHIGYIHNNDTKCFIFPVTRPLYITCTQHEGEYYLKTRDVAQLLGIKQPFQFVANIKKILGKESVLNGVKTEEFRGKEDDYRTTFINGKDLLHFFTVTQQQYKQNKLHGMYLEFMQALDQLVNEKQNHRR